MVRAILLSAALFAFWLLLSGNYKTFLVVSGLVSAVLVVAFARAKRVIDDEGFPVDLLPRALGYWLWLFRQIVLSALDVSRIILTRGLPISPTMVAVEARQASATGLVTYANSITLTPGTISVEVSERDRRIWVHAITRENAAGFAEDEMNARVAALEGGAAAGRAR